MCVTICERSLVCLMLVDEAVVLEETVVVSVATAGVPARDVTLRGMLGV